MENHSITLKGKHFQLSALTLGDLRQLEPALLGAEQKVACGFSSMLALVPVIHASISKLHPELALEELENLLDLNSFSEALGRVLEVSGLRRVGYEAAAGESKPAAK